MTGHSIKYYRDILAHRARIGAFQRAIAQVVNPGDRVLEVGAGLGTFAFFAADAGATRVWAVEGEPVVHVAQTIARANGYGDRVEFIRGWIPEVAVPERATVVIYEDYPARLLDPFACKVLTALRERYAAPQARWIPRAARALVAPVASPDLARMLHPLGADGRAFGIDWSPTQEYFSNTPHTVWLGADAVSAAPAVIGAVRFDESIEAQAIGGSGRCTLTRDTVLHGLAYWFDLDLAEGVAFSNAPGAATPTWGQTFLPADPPLSVRAGETLEWSVELQALSDGKPRWFRWTLGCGAQHVQGHEFAGAPAGVTDLTGGDPETGDITGSNDTH